MTGLQQLGTHDLNELYKKGPETMEGREKEEPTTSTDSGRGRLLQVGRLKDQVLGVTHLDDLTTHETQLKSHI